MEPENIHERRATQGADAADGMLRNLADKRAVIAQGITACVHAILALAQEVRKTTQAIDGLREALRESVEEQREKGPLNGQ